MSDYKPGTPADIYYADTKVRGLRVPGGWSLETDWASFLSDDVVSDVRPLVVLDPDDVEQMDVLCKALVEAAYAHGNKPVAHNGIHPDTLVDALRSLSRPPKPAEPQGLGAVVEDSEGVLWVRSSLDGEDNLGKPWKNGPVCKHWQIVDAVRVLSDGWEPKP